MNIALVILHADPARGGAERYTVDLARDLAQHGHTVSILSSTFGAEPIEAVQFVQMDAAGRTRLGRYRAFLDSVERHLDATHFDAVHAMLPVRRCDLYHPHAGLAAQAVERGSVISRWGNRLNRRRQYMALVERQLLESASPPIVLCLSNYIKAEVRRWYPNLPEHRLVRLFNGVDLARFDPSARPLAGQELRQRLGLRPDAIVALMLAQDFARKGLDRAIKALAQVDDPRLTLLVAGRPDPAPYRRLAASLGVETRVHFAGQTDDSYAFYRAADMLVLPTSHDPCSLVVLEALAMGVPVISTAANGACEAMESSVHGFVLPDPSDIAALAAALTAIADRPTRARQAAACLHLRNQLSQEAHVRALESIYGRLKQGQP